MRDYGIIHGSFWTNPEIQSLSDDGRMLAIYLLAGPHTTPLGFFRVPDGYVNADIGWTPERVSKGFDELLLIGFANRCQRSLWVFIPNYLKWNPVENPNQGKYIAKLISQIPRSCSLIPELIQALENYGQRIPESAIKQLKQTLSKPLPKPFRNHDHDHDHDQEHEQEQKQKQNISPEPSRASELECDEPANISLITNTGADYPIMQAAIDELIPLYPAVDVPQALREMRAWCIGNPAKRKTKAGMMRFVTSWLSRAQNEGPKNGNGARAGPIAKARAIEDSYKRLKEHYGIGETLDGEWTDESGKPGKG